jgi:hypothetical protein
MAIQSAVQARGSLRTAFFNWLTKMLVQWLIVCGPFVIFIHCLCPELAPMLALKLIGYSMLVAALAATKMMLGVIAADEDGVRYYKYGRMQLYIPWRELEFRKPFPHSIEKSFSIGRRGVNKDIKIFPSMNGYRAIKDYFAQHKIELEERRILICPNSEFRPLDEVISEALGPSAGR